MSSLGKTIHLLYHEIVSGPRPYAYATTAECFGQHLAFFNQLSLEGASIQARITFDDGHRSLHDYALPMLQEHGLSAHLFITAGWIGQRPQYLEWAQLRAFSEVGHTIGAHGWNHALLTRCSDAQLQTELVDARKLLEDKLGVPITTLSFPGGRFDQRVINASRAAGYRQFFTSIPQVEFSSPGEMVGRVNIRQTMDARWMHNLFLPSSGALRRLRMQETAKLTLKRLLGDDLYGRLWSRLNHESSQLDEVS